VRQLRSKGAIRGELMRPAPDDSEYPLLVGEQLNNPAYTKALGALNRERQRLGVKSPCESNPSLWDGMDHEEGATDLIGEAMRVEDAIAQCTYCPVLNQCVDVQLVNLTNDKLIVRGVMGAVFVDDSVNGGYINHYLENGEWPEGIDPTRI